MCGSTSLGQIPPLSSSSCSRSPMIPGEGSIWIVLQVSQKDTWEQAVLPLRQIRPNNQILYIRLRSIFMSIRSDREETRRTPFVDALGFLLTLSPSNMRSIVERIILCVCTGEGGISSSPLEGRPQSTNVVAGTIGNARSLRYIEVHSQ